ncbi:CU044_2847 family protein [Streptomyces sp. NPDC004752]
MAGGVEQIRLDDGTVVWARIGAADDAGPDDGYRDTGFGGRIVDMAGGLAGTVGGVVRSLRAGLDTTEPVEVSVSFGIELTAQSGKIVSAIAEGGGTSSLNVSLTWTEPVGDGPGTDPATDRRTGAATGSPAPDPE